MKKEARITWSEAEGRWILYLWIDEEWTFSKAWTPRDVQDGMGFVYEGVLTEIAKMQNLGYDVKVMC